jgi:hypothetical protein
VRALPDGCPDEPVPEAEGQVRPRWDDCHQASSAWDAWDGARPDATENAAHPFPVPPVDAERSAARAQDVPVPSVRHARLTVRWEHRAVAAELCTPDGVRFAVRSCAVLALPVRQESQAQPDAEVQLAPRKLSPSAQSARAELPLLVAEVSDAAARPQAAWQQEPVPPVSQEARQRLDAEPASEVRELALAQAPLAWQPEEAQPPASAPQAEPPPAVRALPLSQSALPVSQPELPLLFAA